MFLEKYLAPQKGNIVDQTGQILGEHDGIHNYTIGQRKGIGIAAERPLYVIGIDAGKNQVIVGDRTDAQTPEFTVQRVNWVSIAAPAAPIQADVQVRYRSQPVMATIIPLADARVKVVFDEPQFSITPGQAAVWYRGDLLLGGGIIEQK
jgi:tRNA-uridine 2-sulfurtransferase